ncbi:type III secretion protein [Burkholderia metallica]|uniref:type III secretion protein n=1 Tax=Burkholderia metallica TaxID=488729 RepID=UPI001CF15AD7|nr:type III secretion protein [Burkholderia metallica]MCA8023436.1 type III secretion protein [Burkholderia metallica]
MYEPITPYAKQFDNLSTVIRDPNTSPTINAIQGALVEIAENVGTAKLDIGLDNRSRTTLYRGLLAASRLVLHIQHTSNDDCSL